MSSINTLASLPPESKRIIVRFDGNVPLKRGFSGISPVWIPVPNLMRGQDDTIIDAYRLSAFIPTLDYLVKNKAERIVLITHIGRPDPNAPDPTLSTKVLIPWFAQQGYPIQFIPKGEVPGPKGIFLLENLRFNEGEKKQDPALAQSLATLADIYINDAWGSMHLKDASITLLPQQFKPTHRGIGLCVENELKYLAHLKGSPDQPFVVVLGGAKLPEKLPLLTALITQAPSQRPSSLIIGGALSLPLLVAQGKMDPGSLSGMTKKNSTNPLSFRAETRNPLIDQEILDVAKTVINTAKANNVTLILPTDFIYENDMAVDIGPESIAAFCTALMPAKTIFLNGTMGKYEDARYAQGTKAILEAVGKNSGYCVIGGGDAAAAVHQYERAQKMSFVSTGGGATLAYLAAKNPESELPGLYNLR